MWVFYVLVNLGYSGTLAIYLYLFTSANNCIAAVSNKFTIIVCLPGFPSSQGFKQVTHGLEFVTPYPYHDIPYPWLVWVVIDLKISQYNMKPTV